ncbi:LysR family transcriptional regulator [Volucribacter amazonae]|uniref:HTH lysR-type domain-containing protein n=1 Tax=Volucribacter amazonae TaxID=256731 RepID=A0A9X4PDF6_9PAST|nr:LysR family transcriptional regulator [Volucribacter amazonae]MDG6895341.1 hypothetical protein [Volucribacter amazonae]
MYQLDQLKAFVLVCELGSFSAAARRLGKAQSSVSQSIANLEIELNQTLFIRQQNQATLTENGKALLPLAQDLLQQAHFFQQKANALSNGEPHQLRILLEETLITDKLLALFAELAERFPLLNLRIASEDNQRIAEIITQGRADLGICYQQQSHPHLSSQVLGNERLIAVAAKHHPLATQRHISAQTLGQYCQLQHDDQPHYRLSPRQWQCNSYYSLCFLAQQGIGWCIMPAQLLNDEWLNELTVLDLAFDLTTPQYPITLLLSHQHKITPATTFLVQGLQKIY